MDLERYYELRTLLHTWKSRLAENLRRQVESSPRAQQHLRTLFDQEGSSEPFSDWLSLWCRQAAIQWILRVLFLRVLEDRGLLGAIRIRTGDGQRMWKQLARNLGASSYLLWCCRDAAHLLPDLFGPTEFDFLLPDDDLMQRFFDDVWRRPDSNREGWLRFDFRPDPDKADEGFQTRFIGDLYQELDSEIRKRHALLQTPHFISQFILKNTLLKRFEEKDFRTVTLIDPTCGSGHFLVDAFWLFVREYEKEFSHRDHREHREKNPSSISGFSENSMLSVAQKTQIARRVIEEHCFGCDINPYATALSRFRLTLAACDYARPALLQELRDLRINIVTIDSLIPYEKIVKQGTWGGSQTAKILGHPDDIQRALPVLQRRYDVVIGNPPYILASDPVKRELYREHYASAYSKFGLSAPFTERFLHMAMECGYVGLINSNAFARRQFGKVLIEEVLPHYDLQAILDLSGAYIPGHGTPTLIIFARYQPPSTETIITLSNIKGEPGTTPDPAHGKVWGSVIEGYGKGTDYIDEYVNVATRPRTVLAQHPWQFGGKKSALYEKLKSRCESSLDFFASSIGYASFTGQDDIFIQPSDFFRKLGFSPYYVRYLIFGEIIRDWGVSLSATVLYPYKGLFDNLELSESPEIARFLNPFKSLLANTQTFGGESKVDTGGIWYEYYRLVKHKYQSQIFITFSEITTHNHFVLIFGGKIFKQTAPVVKLKNENLELYKFILGILNTNLVCFVQKQLCFNKKPGNDPVRDGYAFNSTNIGKTPIPKLSKKTEVYFLSFVNEIIQLSDQLGSLTTKSLFFYQEEAYHHWYKLILGYTPQYFIQTPFSSRTNLDNARKKLNALRESIRSRMIFLQEEMDWLAYEMYGLIDKAPLAEDYLSEANYKAARLELGQRPFELADKGYQGDWLPGYQPAPLPDFLKPLMDARIAMIQSNPDIALLEDPLYKRRWIPPDYEQEFREAAAWWLAEKLEFALEQYGKPISLREWARLLSGDERVNAVLEVLTGSQAFNLESELLKIIEANAVPNRPEHVFKLSGLRKYLNRPQDDEGLPPEFERKDFSSATTWRLRGKLNIPRERFIAYREFDHNWRGANIPDSGGPWYGWAGWTPAQRADALANLLERANRAGWEITFRQCGLRAALRDLLPELKDLRPAERSEFESIASACGIGLETPCYCQAFQEAYKQGAPCSPGLSAEVLGLKPIEVESEQPRSRRRKASDKPTQMGFDL